MGPTIGQGCRPSVQRACQEVPQEPGGICDSCCVLGILSQAPQNPHVLGGTCRPCQRDEPLCQGAVQARLWGCQAAEELLHSVQDACLVDLHIIKS